MTHEAATAYLMRFCLFVFLLCLVLVLNFLFFLKNLLYFEAEIARAEGRSNEWDQDAL